MEMRGNASVVCFSLPENCGPSADPSLPCRDLEIGRWWLKWFKAGRRVDPAQSGVSCLAAFKLAAPNPANALFLPADKSGISLDLNIYDTTASQASEDVRHRI
jgi:hypothetical protein